MRHPFWSWASCLSLGLAGCLHGFQDRQTSAPSVSERLDASKPFVAGQSPALGATNTPSPRPPKVNVSAASASLTRQPSTLPQPEHTVALRQEDAVGQVQYLPPPPAPPSEPAPAKPAAARPAAAKPAVAKPAPQQPSTQRPTLPQSTSKQPVLGESVRQPAPQTLNRIAPPPATSTPQAPQPFAEFERAIPLRSSEAGPPESSNVKVLLPPPPAPAAEDKSTEREVPSLPVIIPRSEPESSVARKLPSPIIDHLQEPPPVAETATPNRVETEPTARPHDVAVLVEQVFENLRQRRITAARERTEQLRHLVANSAKGTHRSAPLKTPPSQTSPAHNGQATGSKIQLLDQPTTNGKSQLPVDDTDFENFFDDDEPVNK